MKRFHMRPQTQETIAGRRATGTACSQIPQKNRKLEMPEVHGGGIGQKVFPRNEKRSSTLCTERIDAEYPHVANTGGSGPAGRRFSRAAQTVHAVQPTVSKAVQAVEDRLGVRIFERANNGVRLTVEGEIVYRRALNILQEFEALEADVAALHKLEKACSASVFPPVASGILFADLLSKYRQLYPGINISLQEQGCASLEPMVLSGDLDLAVTLLPVPPNFSWLQIRDEPLMVIMPPDHPLADRKRLKMDELADNAFIGFEQGFLLNDRIKAVCRQRGLKLNECLRSGQLDFIMTLVATGIGVALLPRLELERRELPNIHIALLDEEELRWRAAFVWRRGAVLSSAAQAWLKLLPGGEEALASERLA